MTNSAKLCFYVTMEIILILIFIQPKLIIFEKLTMGHAVEQLVTSIVSVVVAGYNYFFNSLAKNYRPCS